MKASTSAQPEGSTTQVINDGVRLDGRGAEQLRGNFFMKPGILSQATGSAFAEFGMTKVVVAVYGPKASEVRREFSESGALSVDVKLAPFATPRRWQALQGQVERQHAHAVTETFSSVVMLDKYPKAVIDVHVLVLEAGGSDLAAIITATSIALADAGIELTGLVTAASVATIREHMILDPSAVEELYSDRSLVLAMQGPQQKVVYMDMHGAFSASEVKAAMELSVSACKYYDTSARDALTSYMQQNVPAV